jgi:hypothetical protein
VHFPHDVLLGWLLGGLVLWAFLQGWDALAAWLKKNTSSVQVSLAFGLSLLMILLSLIPFLALQHWVIPAEWLSNVAQAGLTEPPQPISMSNAITYAGTLFGFLLGLAWLQSRGGFDASGQTWKRVARFLVGLIGVLAFYLGLKLIFPEGEALLPSIFRYIRYALIGLWISAGAPYVFQRLGLV